MREFSLKPKVEPLDISVDGQQVHVRQLTAGDKVRMSEMMGSMAALAAQVRSSTDATDAESLGKAAASSLSGDQFKAFTAYQAEVVFVRWCNKDGTPRFADRAEFDQVPAELIDAIYTEASKGDPSEKDAEGNS